jgi:hypothetical protein
MTELEIYEKLGLEPPKEWSLKRLHQTDIPDYRRMGRTTATLVRALYHSQSGNVLILAHSWDLARLLQRRLQEYAERLGWAYHRVLVEIPRGIEHYQELRLQYWEADHLAWESDKISPELKTTLNLRALEPCSEIEEHGPQGRSS